jgi:hypothetical protein
VNTSKQVVIRYPAGRGARFAPTAFDVQVGQTIRVVGARPDQSALGTLLAAEVVDGGRAVLLTIGTQQGGGRL